MTRYARVQGDTGDTLAVQLTGVATFTSALAIAKVWIPGGTAESLTAEITPEGVCTVALGTWLADAVGDYLIEYEITFDDGSVITWPEGPPDQVHVRADA
jgi:hypothetical protein